MLIKNAVSLRSTGAAPAQAPPPFRVGWELKL